MKREKRRAWYQKYRAKNRARIAKVRAAYRKKNRERIREVAAAYEASHREQRRASRIRFALKTVRELRRSRKLKSNRSNRTAE